MVWMLYLGGCASSTTPRPVSGVMAKLIMLPHPPKSQNVRELTHLLSLGPEVGVAATGVPAVTFVVIVCCGCNTLI